MQALKIGRIDPDIYRIDPNTQRLTLVSGLAPDDNLQVALDQVNQTAAGATLAAAHARLSQPSALGSCPSTTYSVDVTQDASDPSGTTVYGWTFNGAAPSSEQMSSCFAALYAPKPQECTSLPLLVLEARCAQRGYFGEPGQAEATSAVRSMPLAEIPSTASPTGESSVTASPLSCHGCSSCGQHGSGTAQDCHVC